ncbi:hypothetical protein [Fluviicola chungangensis]|uniref:Uncharacterized protein n=1 Tax=Fluviicola chungangensis TaxID=2597671 RepID=A0A556MP83_9FLAO|nr:hypothetical protein [Fluviicola chungangensis]TSJ41608.1 hypothetical protein FO442_14195 [Fluviicola chungangensis]
MDAEKTAELKKRKQQLQEEVRLKGLRNRIAFQLAYLDEIDQPYTIHYESENLHWIYSTVQTRKKDGYFGIHGDFQMDVNDSTTIETIEMRKEELNSGKFQQQFLALIPDTTNIVICYDGGDPELEISAKTFLSNPTKFISHPDTWIITTDKKWIIEHILDQEAIRFIQIQLSTPTLVKKILFK